MGGKRPDQHNIDPGEAGATDYKDRTDDEHVHQEEKHEFVQSRKEAKEEGFIPKAGKNPALADLQARREKKREDEQAE